MRRLIVGYQLCSDSRFVESIIRRRDQVSEVYFAWPGIANGRGIGPYCQDLPLWKQMDRMRDELRMLSAAKLRFNLLLNGNCYGAQSLARSFYQEIGSLVDDIGEEFGLDSITTTSPIIARFIKQNFPQLEVRASINMEIGTREGMEYLADVMDGFYVRRELNRNFEKLRAFSESCRSMGKKVYLLANSGCLNHCSARQFHDNLVSHETELMKMDNAYAFDGMCRSFLANAQTRRRILQISNWIRPEDLHRYESLADGFKLATRVSRNPEMILEAYASDRFSGNLLSLMEPDFSGLYWPQVLSGNRMPADFFEKTAACGGDCHRCGYCIQAFDQAAEALDEGILY